MRIRERRKAVVLCGNCAVWYLSPEDDALHGIGKCRYRRHQDFCSNLDALGPEMEQICDCQPQEAG